MSFTKNDRPRFAPARARFVLPPLATSPMVRLLAFALVAFVAAVYGLARHYGAPRPPMTAPATPTTAPTYDADAGELPVPDEYLGDGG